jgi:hypothetical protein
VKERAAGLADLSNDLAGPEAVGLEVSNRVHPALTPLVGRVEDLSAVVRAGLLALTVLGRRVMDMEEELEDVPIGVPLGIEADLDGLGFADYAKR